MTDLPSIDDVFSALEDLRARRPLVHNITNYVAMTVCANVLLALGALGKPWVLDPVGCGATAYRTQVAAELAALAPTVIRAQRCQGTGHLPAEICNALYRMDHATLARHVRLSA